MQSPEFWKDAQKSANLSRELSLLQRELEDFDKLKEEMNPEILAAKLKEKEFHLVKKEQLYFLEMMISHCSTVSWTSSYFLLMANGSWYQMFTLLLRKMS